MLWQRRHYPNATEGRAANYGFPSVSVPCKGHGLDDTIATAEPFDQDVALGGGGVPKRAYLTNREAIRMDGYRDQLYTYDTLLEKKSQN